MLGLILEDFNSADEKRAIAIVEVSDETLQHVR